MKIIINPSAKMQMSKNLKELRKKSGLSQEGVTAKMNLLGSSLERSAYSKIELGVRNIKATDLIILQEIYGVDYAEFFKGIPTHE